MRRNLVLLILGLAALTACNCGGSGIVVKGGERDVNTVVLQDEGQQGRRLVNKNLTEHMAERTVSVRKDCSPKKNVVIIGGGNPETRHDGRGSGIIVKSYANKSYIFTAAHVISIGKKNERKHFTCKLFIQVVADANSSKNRIPARIVSKDEHRDIAVLEVDQDMKVSSELELSPFTGEDIWAVGFPVQLASRKSVIISITKGTLATKNVPVYGNASKNGNYHRITSQVYFGNSGGGVWTKEGKLTGIVVSLYAADKRVPYEGYYYAKPVNEVVRLLQRRWAHDSVFRNQ